MYYKKQGRKYIPVNFAELDGKWSPGLYLIYQNTHSSAIENLTVQKVHDCKDLSLYADMVAKMKDKLLSNILADIKISDICERMFVEIINLLIEDEKQNSVSLQKSEKT